MVSEPKNEDGQAKVMSYVAFYPNPVLPRVTEYPVNWDGFGILIFRVFDVAATIMPYWSLTVIAINIFC